MDKDKNGKEVKLGDFIKFRYSNKEYQVLSENGILGCYEDGEFIPLKDILRNYEVVEFTY